MVENKKKKYGICWSSSEKTDSKQRYGNFHISAMPYPGTEFFTEWKNNNYNGNSLHFSFRFRSHLTIYGKNQKK